MKMPHRLSYTPIEHGSQTEAGTGGGSSLEAKFDSDDAFVRADLVDIAAQLPLTHRDPAQLRPTQRGGARVDRFYAHPASPPPPHIGIS